MGERIFAPAIIETKQELLVALKAGQLKVSQYNLLNENEKMFVELIAFGGYTAEQAVRVIDPTIKMPDLIANRMLTKKEVSNTLDELTMLRGKKFLAELSNTRDLALSKLKYIMTTTKDDSLAAACAKTIIDKSVDIMKAADKKEDPVSQIRFNIQVENMYTGNNPISGMAKEPIIIPISEEELEEADIANEMPESTRKSRKKLPIGSTSEESSYVLSYEGVDMYNINPDDPSEEDIEEEK